MGDNKQWKGRKRQEGMWEGGGIIYWETAYPSFLIVLVWLGFYLPFPPPSSFIHFSCCFVVRPCSTSLVLSYDWIWGSAAACLNLFILFGSKRAKERNFLVLASNFPPGSYLYEWSPLVTYFWLDWTCDTHETLLYFRRVFFLQSFSFSGWCEFEKDWAAISSKAVQLESLMVKCQRVGSEI